MQGWGLELSHLYWASELLGNPPPQHMLLSARDRPTLQSTCKAELVQILCHFGITP